MGDFQPGIIRKAIQDNFGIRPILQRSRHINYADKEGAGKTVQRKYTADEMKRRVVLDISWKEVSV